MNIAQTTLGHVLTLALFFSLHSRYQDLQYFPCTVALRLARVDKGSHSKTRVDVSDLEDDPASVARFLETGKQLPEELKNYRLGLVIGTEPELDDVYKVWMA
jgi:hypothetical protein